MENKENKPLSRRGANKYEYAFQYEGLGLNVWVCLLLSIISAMITILSTSSLGDNGTATVFIIFLSILIVMSAIYLYGIWGVVTAGLSAVLFCVLIQTSLVSMAINVAANVAQALIIYLVFKSTKIDEGVAERNGITDYKFLLVAVGILYVVLSFIFDRTTILYVFLGVVALLSVAFSIIERKPTKFLFFLLVCFLPSLSGGVINSISVVLDGASFGAFYDSTLIWTASNTILFGTFGYLLLTLLGRFAEKSHRWQRSKAEKKADKKPVTLKLSTIMFYIATFVWNVLFYVMYVLGWLNVNTVTYIFPWGVGNAFFLTNMLFTLQKEFECDDQEKAFSWYENRAVVAENNTQMIIAIIAFLLPLSASYLGSEISVSIWFAFVLNITTAVVSIGLIWVPQNNVRFMEFIKNFKTIFHLFTLSLLLLSAIMIINGGVIAL